MAYCVTGNYSIQNCLGIGVETPTYGVDVRGTGVGTAAIALNNTSANGREWAIYSTGNSFSQGCGGLLFYRAWCDAAGGSMYIDCLGKVGIGTVSPTAVLQVRGPNATGTFFDAQNDGAAGATFVRANNTFPYNEFTFANGNVGIGTTPTSLSNVRLQICDGNAAGTDDMVRLMQCLPGNHAWYRSQRCGGATMIMGATRNSGDGCVPSESAIVWTLTNNPLVFGTCNRERMRIATNGNAVLGGTSANIVGFTGTVLTVNGGGNYQGYEVSTSNVTRMTMVSDGNNGYLSTRVAGMCLIFEAGAASEKMRITSDGNVGIGITDENPLGNGGTYRNLLVGNGAGYGVFQGVSTATATNSTIVAFSGGTTGASNAKNGGSINLELDATSTTNAIGRWAFYTRDSGGTIATRMTISSGGNVGVGITTPCAPLSFNNVEGNKIDFYYTAAGSGDRYGIQVQSSELRIHSGAAGASTGGITFGKQSTSTFTEAMRVTNAGCVGIGTATPSYRLHVNGTFYAAGSSIKYKEGICNYDTNSCLFMCLKPVAYQYKDEFKHLGKELKADTQIGLIAEDVAEVMPELAVLVNEEDEKVVRNVDYEKLSIVLLSELQKLRKEVDELKNNK